MPDDMEDFRALDPFFRIIEQGLVGLVDGDHFFDLLAEDVVFDFVITVPDYPRHVVGRDNLIELYRGYGSTFFLDSCYDGQQTANTPQWTRRHLISAPNDGTNDQPLHGLARDHSRRSGMKDTVSHYIPPQYPLTSTAPQAFSNNLTMPSRLSEPLPRHGDIA